MSVAGIGPFKQAFVGALRDISALTAAVGSKGINEGVVPRGTSYPFVVYQVIYAPISREMGSSATYRVGFEVSVVSDDQVEAHNLDQLITDGMDDKIVSYPGSSGLTSLFCRRLSGLSLADVDGQGERIYQMNSIFELWAQS